MTLTEISLLDDACLEFLFKSRWPDGVVCQKCQKVTPHYRISGRPVILLRTLWEPCLPHGRKHLRRDPVLPSPSLVQGVAYMAVTRCGISSRQLSRDLGVGVKTGWRMFHQIRKALSDDGAILEGDVEVDETYIGGRRSGKRGRGAEGKTIVMGMVERGGKAKAKVVPDVKARTLVPEIQSSVPVGTAVLTDDLPSYRRLSSLGYQHDVVPHSRGVYVVGKDIHTTSVEGILEPVEAVD